MQTSVIIGIGQLAVSFTVTNVSLPAQFRETHSTIIRHYYLCEQVLPPSAMWVPTKSILYLDQLKTEECIKCTCVRPYMHIAQCTISTSFAFKTTLYCEFFFQTMEIWTAEVNSVEPNPSETKTKQFMNIEVLTHSDNMCILTIFFSSLHSTHQTQSTSGFGTQPHRQAWRQTQTLLDVDMASTAISPLSARRGIFSIVIWVKKKTKRELLHSVVRIHKYYFYTLTRSRQGWFECIRRHTLTHTVSEWVPLVLLVVISWNTIETKIETNENRAKESE